MERTVCLSHHDGVEGVGLVDGVVSLDLSAGLDEEVSTVGDIIADEGHVGIGVDDAHLCLSANDHLIALAVLADGVHGAELIDLEDTVVLSLDVALHRIGGGDTTGVEGTESQLCTRLTDRLCRYDTDHLAHLDGAIVCQVTTVTLGADTLLALTGEDGADLHLGNRRLLDLGGSLLVDLFIGSDNQLSRDRVDDVVDGAATEDALIERCDDVLSLLDLTTDDTAERTAVLLGDDHIGGDIDETTGQVTGVGGLECRIGESLAGTVGGDEVVEYGETLLEVGQDRILHRLSALTTADRLGHQTTDTGELLDLIGRSTCTGVHHHVDGIEAVLVLLELLHEHLGDLVIDVGPDVDDLIVTLVVGDDTEIEVIHDLLDLAEAIGDDLLLLLRYNDVGEVEGEACLVGHVVAEVLDPVEEGGALCDTAVLDHLADDESKVLLTHHSVVEWELALGHHLIEEHTTIGGLDDVGDRLTLLVEILYTCLDDGVHVETALIVSDLYLLEVTEYLALALGSGAGLGDVVESEDHVLSGHGDRGAVGGIEDIL